MLERSAQVIREFRYAGPDGEGIPGVPEGCGAALGSEYCVHLLPGVEEMARAIPVARARRMPLILLTPYFRDGELKRTMPLFRAIPGGDDVLVAVNDWGLLLALRVLLPGLALSIGRLLSGQKHCPRIEASTRLTPEGRAWHRQGLFSSGAARAYLREEFGVRGFHVDADGGGLPPLPPDGERAGGGGEALFVHMPHAIVTVSDTCPWIGGRSSAAVATCSRPCRDGAVALREPSMGGDLVQRGKARFVRSGDLPADRIRSAGAAGIVRYEDVP